MAGLTAASAILAPASAEAANGTEPGNLILTPASGPATLTPTWSTTTPCPAGFRVSAQLSEFNTDGSFASRISPVKNSTGPFTGGLLFSSVGDLIHTSTNLPATGGTVEWAVGCYSGAGGGGAVVYVQSMFVTLDSAGNYTTSPTPPVLTATTTTLTAPSSTVTGTTINLSASVAAGSAFPAGAVQFMADGNDLGAPVAVNTGGASAPATTSTSFAVAGAGSLSAEFIPADPTAYASSTGTAEVTVLQAGSMAAGSVPIDVTVPPSGTLTVTVAPGTPGTFILSANSPATTPDQTAFGYLPDVTVTDTRNYTPGWLVTGQESDFAGSGSAAGATISGNALGWLPLAVRSLQPGGSLEGGAMLGAAVAPVGANATSTGPGLGSTAAVLAQADAGSGFGTNTLTAQLLLDIPQTAPPGPYTGSLTITYVEAGP